MSGKALPIPAAISARTVTGPTLSVSRVRAVGWKGGHRPGHRSLRLPRFTSYV